jgi:uncharacterized protein YcnI
VRQADSRQADLRRAALAAAAVALAAAPAAAGGVSVTPRRVAPGQDVLLTFAVPNENERRADAPRVVIAMPPDFKLEDAGARPGWTAQVVGSGTVSWRGGSIPPGQFETFTLRGTTPHGRVRLVFTVLVAHTSGPTDTYRPAVLVAPMVSTHDPGARTLGGIALAVALAAAAIAIGGGFLALWLWLRPPL